MYNLSLPIYVLFYVRVWTDYAEHVLPTVSSCQLSDWPTAECLLRTVLYDAFYSYLCRCYRNGILGPSSPPLPGESFDTCSKAVAFTLADTQVFQLVNLLYFQWGSLGPLRMVGKLNVFYMLGCDEVILLDGLTFYITRFQCEVQ